MTMCENNDAVQGESLLLIQCGPMYRLAGRLGLNFPHPLSRLRKVLVLLLFTWLPLIVLSTLAGHAWPGNVKVPILHDLELHGRFLMALPLFEIASAVISLSLVSQSRSFLDMDLVPTHQHERFYAARAWAQRQRESLVAEVLILMMACAASVGSHVYFGYGAGESSWERSGKELTWAGWWLVLISLPVLYFLLLRWVWILIVWANFLFRVSRLDLKLTATHPDRVGGLGFLAWGTASFAPLLMACSAMVAAGMADIMFHDGVQLTDLKEDVGACIVVELLLVHGPLFVFVAMLSRCRFEGLLKLGKLILVHDRAFEDKWLEHPSEHQQELLGSADIQSLADAGTVYAHVDEMRLFLFDMKAFALLAISALIPFATLLPIHEMLLRLGELLF